MNRIGLKRTISLPRIIMLALLAAALPGCGIVGPCSPVSNNPAPSDNNNNIDDNPGDDNPGDNNPGDNNTNPDPTGCDSVKCSSCDATSCLSITRAEHFTNGSLNILGESSCAEDLAVDWYTTDNVYLQTFFIFGDGRSSTVGQFDSATASKLTGYRVRRNSQPECLCSGCPAAATP